MLFTISFEGDAADDHLIPARDGTRAISAITKSVLISAEYLVFQRVKQRYPFQSMELFLEPPEDGSWKTNVVALLGTVAVGVGSSAIWDFSKYVMAAAVGQDVKPTTPEAKAAVGDHYGDTEAVINNVKPQMRAAHDIIGAGARNVIIVGGAGNTVILDAESKAYVNAENLDTEIETKYVGVGMLNVNSRFGKVFDYELMHLVTTEVARNAPAETIPALVSGLQKYANGNRGPTVYIKYMTYRDHLNRPTRYLILEASADR